MRAGDVGAHYTQETVCCNHSHILGMTTSFLYSFLSFCLLLPVFYSSSSCSNFDSQNPKMPELKVLQSYTLLKELEKIFGEKGSKVIPPLVITGDFNCFPNSGMYQLYSTYVPQYYKQYIKKKEEECKPTKIRLIFMSYPGASYHTRMQTFNPWC